MKMSDQKIAEMLKFRENSPLYDLLNQLHPQPRDLIVRCFIHKQSIKDLAEMKKCPKSEVVNTLAENLDDLIERTDEKGVGATVRSWRKWLDGVVAGAAEEAAESYKNLGGVELGRKGGLAPKKQKLTHEQRSVIARKAAQARWNKKPAEPPAEKKKEDAPVRKKRQSRCYCLSCSFQRLAVDLLDEIQWRLKNERAIHDRSFSQILELKQERAAIERMMKRFKH